eukprot:s334_g20.t1
MEPDNCQSQVFKAVLVGSLLGVFEQEPPFEMHLACGNRTSECPGSDLVPDVKRQPDQRDPMVPLIFDT